MVALVFAFIRTRAGLWFRRDGREYWRSKDNRERACRDNFPEIAEALGTSRDTVRRAIDRLESTGQLDQRTDGLWVSVAAARERWQEGRRFNLPGHVLPIPRSDLTARDKVLLGRIVSTGGIRYGGQRGVYVLDRDNYATDINSNAREVTRSLRKLRKAELVETVRVGRYVRQMAIPRAVKTVHPSDSQNRPPLVSEARPSKPSTPPFNRTTMTIGPVVLGHLTVHDIDARSQMDGCCPSVGRRAS